MFEIWDETGQASGLTLPQLQQRLVSYQGDVMVRYTNRIGLPTTLFFDADGRLVHTHMGELTRASLADTLRKRFGTHVAKQSEAKE